jgi:REP element-mobilizing transposase RayT/ActR/RegA family two-component response regulator
MAINLIIVTPHKSFGALIHNGIDTTRYNTFATSDFSEAIHYVRKTNCPIAVLDAELEDVELSVLDIGIALRQIKPDIQFILVAQVGQAVDVTSLAPAATLVKPLSVPELKNWLEKLTSPVVKVKNVPLNPITETNNPERSLAETSRLMWLKDVSKAAQHLTRLTLESSAQAALITRQNELWAYAGQLSRDAAQELTESIQRYWDDESESDLLRFVRLQSTEAQHMLYARKLSANMILALVFDAETPFSTIRSQAGKLIKNLSDNNFDEAPQATQPEVQAPRVAEVVPPIETPTFAPDTDEGEYEEDLPPISELLGEVPPPIPPKLAPTPEIHLPWEQIPAPRPFAQKAVSSEPRAEAPKFGQESQKSAASNISLESSPAIRRDAVKRPIPALDQTFAAKTTDTETDEQTAETRPVEVPDDMALTRKHDPRKDPESLIETRPQVVSESVSDVAHRILLEPASPALVNLSYACLLIPRFDTHHLVGDFVDRLNEWVPQVCIAFGWRLEHISVRPEYLQWVARVPPSTAPGYIMRIVRQQTSDRIFAEFPRYKAENPSGDFWAPGYLIMGSSQPHPQKLVREFIKQTRARQGLGF